MKRRPIITLAAVAALAACGLVSRGTRHQPPADQPPAEQPTPVASAAADQPTAEPATAEPATAEPATAEPSAADYAAWLRKTVGELSGPTDELAQHLADAGDRPALFVDDAWKLSVAANLAALQVAADALKSRETPDAAKAARGRVLAIATSLDTAATLTARGIDKLDADTLRQGMAELAAVGPLLVELDRVLERIAPSTH